MNENQDKYQHFKKEYFKQQCLCLFEGSLSIVWWILIIICLIWTAVYWFNHDELTFMGIVKWEITHQWGAWIYLIVVRLLASFKFQDDFGQLRQMEKRYSEILREEATAAKEDKAE